jgi:murein DD-endopeptidase MepM/ murein hydrolase activator NlpD
MEFHWPCGTEAERIEYGKLPGAWIAATKYAQRYDATGRWAIHTGLDLNLNTPRFDADAHAPIYAAEGGVVVYAGKLPVWGSVIVIKHVSETRSAIFTRYAHGEAVQVATGQLVTRGMQLARVGNADGRYPYHLHYDMATVDLEKAPADWPGDNLSRVLRDYIDPMALMRDQLAHADGAKADRVRITAEPRLRVRAQPSRSAAIVGYMYHDEVVALVGGSVGWGRIAQPAGWIELAWTAPA